MLQRQGWARVARVDVLEVVRNSFFVIRFVSNLLIFSGCFDLVRWTGKDHEERSKLSEAQITSFCGRLRHSDGRAPSQGYDQRGDNWCQRRRVDPRRR